MNKPKTYTRADIRNLIAKAKRRERNYYALDHALYDALDDYPIAGNEVAVIGSLVPWYEAMCLSRGATPVTIDYNPVDYRHPKIRQMSMADASAAEGRFDYAFSLSTFEHSGLGRYGDPINPTGDLEAMAWTKRLLRKTGILFLSLPVGEDAVVTDRHRVYGTARLPLLLRGWTQLAAYRMPRLPVPKGKGWTQPVLVLRNDK